MAWWSRSPPSDPVGVCKYTYGGGDIRPVPHSAVTGEPKLCITITVGRLYVERLIATISVSALQSFSSTNKKR